jgi:hypothetical protein
VGYPVREGAAPVELRTFLLAAIPLVLALLFIGGAFSGDNNRRRPAAQMARASLGGHIDYIAEPDRAQAEVTRMARESHGDFWRLSRDDRRWLDSMTAGHGPQAIERAARLARQAEKHTRKAPPERRHDQR